jgi:pimeloyl-ACP methyl ester carboxylesterase
MTRRAPGWDRRMKREEVRFASGGSGDECAATLFLPDGAGTPVPCVAMGSGLSCVRNQGMDDFGGIRHVLRLAGAGLRDSLRALRGAEPYRVPAAGPPGMLAALNSPGSLPGFEAVTREGSTWSNALCARVALAPPYSLARKVRGLPCPTLYCLTEEDDINPPALGRLAAQRAPRGELKLYPGGHLDPFLGDNLDRMAADQVEFLRRNLGVSDQS